MELTGKIAEMATSHLTSPAHFIVDVTVSKGVPKKVTVIVDGDDGVTIEDCALVSRSLSDQMEELAIIEDSYVLEVSTPGLESPLKLKRQYKKNVGREFKVTLKDKSIIKGKLVEASDDKISLEEEVKDGKKKSLKKSDISFENIEKAIVMVSFK